MNICLLLAQKYDVQRWEVMLSFAEFLFTDSGYGVFFTKIRQKVMNNIILGFY